MEAIYKKNKNLIHTVIRDNFPFLIDTADYEDAFQEGSIGLIRAIDRFDDGLEYKFSSYAYTAIRNQIAKQAFKYRTTFKVTENSYHTLMAYTDYRNQGYSFDEIAEKLNTTPFKLINILNVYDNMSIESPVTEDFTLMDIVKDDINLEEELLNNYLLRSALTLCKMFLSEEDYFIISNYYNGVTQTKISKLLNRGTTTINKRVTKIENRIFPVFRDYLEGKIRFGELCESLVRLTDNTRAVLNCYFNYALDTAEKEGNNDFLEEYEVTLASHNPIKIERLEKFVAEGEYSYYQIRDILSDIVKVVDEYFSKEGIEYIIMNHIISYKLG